MRRSLLTLLLLMPLAAAGQIAPVGSDATASQLLGQAPGAYALSDQATVPLWRSKDGRMLRAHAVALRGSQVLAPQGDG